MPELSNIKESSCRTAFQAPPALFSKLSTPLLSISLPEPQPYFPRRYAVHRAYSYCAREESAPPLSTRTAATS